MLDFDDNMLKLAKMHETLLKVDANNRQENLEKYKSIIVKIDKQAFSSLLDELSEIINHNQTLSDELQFLDDVSNHYKQLDELQLCFRNVCELYGDGEVELSDLSKINIDYINHRKGIMEGYLINLKNIEINKVKLEKLNDALIHEEKNKLLLSKRLLDYEEGLRKNFINAEGRVVVDGKLQYISVVSEYKGLGYDFKLLLLDRDKLRELLSNIDFERTEIDEKHKTAEICYNSNPSSGSKQILDDINREFFKVRYRLTMLKILELLSNDFDDCEQFREKREKILDLIKYRIVCLKNLGEHISIDPFGRTKIEEQLNATDSFLDNSKKIRSIKEEILELSNFVDEMISQNSDYRIDLDVTEDLIIDNVSMSDIVSVVDVPESIYIEEQRVSDNQVVSIKDVTNEFNLSIVRQKTSGVIKRVNQMMTTVSIVPEKKIEIVSPELVIVNDSLDIDDDIKQENYEEKIDDILSNDSWNEDMLLSINFEDENEISNLVDSELVVEEKYTEQKEEDSVISSNYNTSIFETVDPFESMPLFMDRADDEGFLVENVNNEQKIDVIDEGHKVEKIDIFNISDSKTDEINDSMEEKFWVTIDNNDVSFDEETDGVVLSFDEQISALLSDEENTKIKKLSA